VERLNQLLAELAELDQQIDALLAHDSLTDDQRAEHDRLVALRGKKTAAIAAERGRIERDQERTQLATETRVLAERQTRLAGNGRLTDDDPPAQRNPAPRSRPAVAIPANVRRCRVRHFKGTIDGRSAEERAYRFGQWCMAALTVQMPARYQFNDAVEWVRGHMEAYKSNDASGLHQFIPTEFSTDMIVLREMYGVCRRLFRDQPMTSETYEQPRRTGGLTAYFTSEGGAITESKGHWDNVKLLARELAALSRIGRSVNADLAISFGDTTIGEIAYAFAEKEDDCGFNGDGTSTYGGITGLRNRLANVGTAGVITQGTGNTWAAIVLADFHNVLGKLPQYADTLDAAWLCHRAFYFGVMQKLELASGGATAHEIREGQRGRPLFLGYPVEFSQKFPAVTAVATLSATFGDHRKAAAFGDRDDIEVAFSEHATIGGENVFERNQIAVRGVERFDINVHDVGDSTNPGPVVGLKTGA
jgi:HK97 family phage major capsid protein